MTDLSSDPLDSALELMYYAFAGLVAAPDRILATMGLARAHHRILYFVARRPGLTVGDLLGALRITKQSLNRPLRDLAVRGLVTADVDDRDRRIRRLRLSPAGAALERRLTGIQRRRFTRVFREVGPARTGAWREVMAALRG